MGTSDTARSLRWRLVDRAWAQFPGAMVGLRNLVDGDSRQGEPIVEPARADVIGPLNRLQRFHAFLYSLRPEDAALLLKSTNDRKTIRQHYADKYLAGAGVELGAQNCPLVSTHATKMEYVDVHTNEYLINYFHLPAHELVPLDHVGDSSDLSKYADGSKDFLIANHVLEHMHDPIAAIKEWSRILRPNGTMLLTVPNYRGNEYDFAGTPTTIEHLIEDHEHHAGPSDARNRLHYEEFVAAAEIARSHPSFHDRVNELIAADDRIHFHAYTSKLLELLVEAASERSTYRLKLIDKFAHMFCYEFLVVLRKS